MGERSLQCLMSGAEPSLSPDERDLLERFDALMDTRGFVLAGVVHEGGSLVGTWTDEHGSCRATLHDMDDAMRQVDLGLEPDWGAMTITEGSEP